MMNNQILLRLKSNLDALAVYGGLNAEVQRNALKEELQFYVLNFIYHHPDYSDWAMYGGSALRICHGLDRMSVDLDFESEKPITEDLLKSLKRAILGHFMSVYGVTDDFLTIKITRGRGVLLRFYLGDELGISHPSKQVYVKIDLNCFVGNKTMIERRPINRGQVSFVIKTYTMSVLMASKIAAIFLRGKRGVGQAVYQEKGRDIYDLLWYMTQKIVPDLDYLVAKKVDVSDLRALFDKLTLKMNEVNDVNLQQDLLPLFINQHFIDDWLKNWRETYRVLCDSYGIFQVEALLSVGLVSDLDILSFIYTYATQEGFRFFIKYQLSGDWMNSREGALTIPMDEKLVELMTVEAQKAIGRKAMKQKQYATLFYQKTENYLKKTNRVVLGSSMTSKLIRMDAKDLNQHTEVLLDQPRLLTCELEDLFQ